MISASVGVNSSLLLEPAQSLPFALDPATAASRGARACLTLTNISPRKLVVFKVRTTNVDMFMVKPAQGVIEPSGEVPVVITLLPPACEKLLRLPPHERAALIERFLIQSIDRSDDMRGFSVDDLVTFWRRLPKELITNKKITCKFIEAREGDPAVHLPLHRLRLHSDELVDGPHASPAQYKQAAPPAVAVPPPVQFLDGNQTSPEPQPPRGPLGKPGQKQERRSGAAPSNNQAFESPPQPHGKVIAQSVSPSQQPPPHMSLSIQSIPQARPPQAIPPPPPPAAPRQPHRTPPVAMNMPSSPVPSLRPQNVFTLSNSSSESSSNFGGNGEVGTGASDGSSDSYATKRKNEMQYDEQIQSDDTLEYRLHPNESLLFPVHHAYPDDSATGIVEGKSYFFITNRARHSGLAFKIKTSNHTGYFVKPARGLIDAKSAQRIDVFVNAPDASRFNGRDREMKDRFLVELLFVNPTTSAELLGMNEDRKRQELQHVWEGSKSADRRQSVLSCQILEEDSPIDPAQQTAEQARVLLQKSQVATTLSYNNNSPVPRDSAGESANPWVHHRPPSPAMHTPRGSNQQQDYQYQNPYHYQPQSPYQHHQQPSPQGVRSPVMMKQSAKQPRSPGLPPQARSPVRPPHNQQQQPYYHTGAAQPQRIRRDEFDDHRTYYA